MSAWEKADEWKWRSDIYPPGAVVIVNDDRWFGGRALHFRELPDREQGVEPCTVSVADSTLIAAFPIESPDYATPVIGA